MNYGACGNYNYPSQNAVDRGQGVNGIGNQNGILGNADPAARNEFNRLMETANAVQNSGQSDMTGTNSGQTMQQLLEQILPLLLQLINGIGQPNQTEQAANNGGKNCGGYM